MIVIYHNPRCSKSRECLQILETNKVEYKLIKYLEEPIGASKLKKIIKLLGVKPIDIIRKQEKLWKDNFKSIKMSDDELIELIIEYPKLMQRPIVISGNKAVIGRPTEKILDLIKT